MLSIKFSCVFDKEIHSISTQNKFKQNKTELKYVVSILIANYYNNDIRKQREIAIVEKIELKCLITNALENNKRTNLAWHVTADEKMRTRSIVFGKC